MYFFLTFFLGFLCSIEIKTKILILCREKEEGCKKLSLPVSFSKENCCDMFCVSINALEYHQLVGRFLAPMYVM